jgi:hypothetical protein
MAMLHRRGPRCQSLLAVEFTIIFSLAQQAYVARCPQVEGPSGFGWRNHLFLPEMDRFVILTLATPFV